MSNRPHGPSVVPACLFWPAILGFEAADAKNQLWATAFHENGRLSGVGRGNFYLIPYCNLLAMVSVAYEA